MKNNEKGEERRIYFLETGRDNGEGGAAVISTVVLFCTMYEVAQHPPWSKAADADLVIPIECMHAYVSVCVIQHQQKLM